MKQFKNLTQLKAAKVLTGSSVTILEPAILTGTVQATGNGLTLISNNVFVPATTAIEAITGRYSVLLSDEFGISNLTTKVNSYKKDDDGIWIEHVDGITCTMYLNGQLWYPVAEIPFKTGGYIITSWKILPTYNLELSLDSGEVLQFERSIEGNTSDSIKYPSEGV